MWKSTLLWLSGRIINLSVLFKWSVKCRVCGDERVYTVYQKMKSKIEMPAFVPGTVWRDSGSPHRGRWKAKLRCQLLSHVLYEGTRAHPTEGENRKRKQGSLPLMDFAEGGFVIWRSEKWHQRKKLEGEIWGHVKTENSNRAKRKENNMLISWNEEKSYIFTVCWFLIPTHV